MASLLDVLLGRSEPSLPSLDGITGMRWAYEGNPVGTSTTRPQQSVGAATPIDPIDTRLDALSGILQTRGQIKEDRDNAWRMAGMISDGGLGMLGMARFIPHVEAAKAMRALQKMGLNVERDVSGVSRSNYLTAEAPGRELDALKLRFSDHALPPRYAQAGYDVGPHMEAHGDGWRDAVDKAARYFGVEAPKYARKAEPIAPKEALPATFSPVAKAQYDMLAAAFPDAGLVQGAPGSAALARQLAAKYEAANPDTLTWIRSLDPKFTP